ncbi:MAG: hypothetical protein ASARMPREDX12_006757 [Alectoria sarmentosa]|nr:MAG: hypothetical protein ASARMPREDX12_006757 [Alectoria sarmentosa]
MATASAPEDPSSATPSSSSPTKAFRFKRPRSPSPSPSEPSRKRHSLSPSSELPQNPRHARRHHHHHRSKGRPHTPPFAYDNGYIKKGGQHMDPDAAFRESLFDALADDEGAAFWQGVYGQPIHTYSPYYPASTSPDDGTPDDAQNPKLERMNDDQYTAYVRKKMWEKSHEHIVEERRRREEERKRKKAKIEEERKWQAGVAEALRRGEERRKRKTWKGLWVGYLTGWEERKGEIFWPVESGKIKDVGTGEVEKFFKGVGGIGDVDLRDVLKKERVRWHPDKMQQRAGAVGIDGRSMKAVTAVFQIVDRLWSEMREEA